MGHPILLFCINILITGPSAPEKNRFELMPFQKVVSHLIYFVFKLRS